MNTIQALQNVYVVLGGDLSDVINLYTIPDMINAIAALETEKRKIVLETLLDRDGNYLTDRNINHLLIRERG